VPRNVGGYWRGNKKSQNSQLYKQTKSVNNRKTVKTVMTLTWYRHYIAGINRISLKKIWEQCNYLMYITVFRLLTDFVCLYNCEFWLSLCEIVRSSVILLLPLFKQFDHCIVCSSSIHGFFITPSVPSNISWHS
jgi:hypothetical protein